MIASAREVFRIAPKATNWRRKRRCGVQFVDPLRRTVLLCGTLDRIRE
jgi:hypothetical protein